MVSFNSITREALFANKLFIQSLLVLFLLPYPYCLFPTSNWSFYISLILFPFRIEPYSDARKIGNNRLFEGAALENSTRYQAAPEQPISNRAHNFKVRIAVVL